MAKTYLFQMTIPSVQKFISASRKSADLWAGSLIVSYLMKKLLNEVINYENIGNKIQLIYPYTDNSFDEKETTANTPNVAIFIVKDITKEEARELKKELKKEFNHLLKELAFFGIDKFFEEFQKLIKNNTLDFYIEKAFKTQNKEKIGEIKKKINEILENKENYKELAKYQIKDTLKLFIEYLPLDRDYKEDLEDLAGIINYEKKSQLPKKAFIENYCLIKSPNWNEKNSWEEFFNEEKENEFSSGLVKGVYRCSSCGEHTIIGADLEDWRGNSVWKPLWEANPKYFNRGERLCGVCLAKRYFREYMQDIEEIKDESLGFPSTSEISATLFKENILNVLKTNPNFNDLLRKLSEALKRIPTVDDNLTNLKGNLTPKLRNELDEIFPSDRNLLKDEQYEIYKLLNIDGEWFIEDIWKNKNDYEVIGADDKKATQMLNFLGQIYNFLKTNRAEKHSKPSEYYTVILLDGDSIGKKLDTIKNLNNPIKVHREFSETLSKLSEEFKNIVEEHYGALIYSGGDDVLALAPVENALDCAYKIRKKYEEELEKFKEEIKKEDGNIENLKDFTMSGATIYAHHKLPLSYILDEVRRCEEKAKEEGKNRVCLKYIKRSLANAEALIGWSKWEDFKQLEKESENIPNTFVYQLKELLDRAGKDKRINKELTKYLLKKKLSNKQDKDRKINIIVNNNLISDDYMQLINLLKVIKFLEG